MELLIPGLALVALMVWASTKIKRSAAAAFEAETIETDDFVLEKPDGFLHVLNDESGKAFRAYSKEYGEGDRKGIRKAEIEIVILGGIDPPKRINEISSAGETILDQRSYQDTGEAAAELETQFTKDDVEWKRYYKLVKRGERLLELRVTVLAEYNEEFADAAGKVIAGFQAK